MTIKHNLVAPDRSRLLALTSEILEDPSRWHSDPHLASEAARFGLASVAQVRRVNRSLRASVPASAR